jgi:RimJ/RimL family protein N-acetyltransferase
MMQIVTYEPRHLREIELTRPVDQLLMAPVLADPDYATALAKAGPAFTGIADGKIIGCVGLMKQWENRAIAWALLTSLTRHHLTAITRAMMAFCAEAPFRRIEAAVDVGWTQSQRWHELMGFQWEGLARAYTPDGRDCLLYARVRNG